MYTHNTVFFKGFFLGFKNKVLIFTSLLFGLFGNETLAQNKTKEALQDSLYAYECLQVAKQLTKESAVEASNICAVEAADAFLQLQDWKKYYHCYRLVTGNALRFQNYSQANLLFQKAIEELQVITTAKQTLGLLYHLQSYVYQLQGGFQKAIKYGEKAAEILETFEDAPDLDVVYLNLANAYNRENLDFEKAIIYSTKALQIHFNKAIVDSNRIAKFYNLIGKAHRGLHQYDRAIVSYQNSMTYIGGLDRHLAFLLSMVYLDKKECKNALDYAQKAFEIAYTEEKIGSDIYLQLASAHQCSKNYSDAESFLKKALLTAKNSYGISDPNYIKIHIYLGIFQEEQNQLNEALTSYQTALQLLEPNFNPTNIRENPQIAENYTSIWTMEAIRYKAYAFEAKFEVDSLQEDLQSALECHELVLANINYRRQRYTSDASKHYITNYIYDTYESAIAAAYQLYQLTDDTAYFNKCFQLIEASKASVLKEAVHEQALQYGGSIPKDLLKALEEVKVELAKKEKEQYDLQKVESVDSLQIAEMESALFDLNRKKERLIDQLGEYPDFFKLKYEENPMTPQQLQEALKPKQAVLEYFVGKEELYACLFTQDTTLIYRQDKPTDFEEQVGNLLENLNNWNYVVDSTTQAASNYVRAGRQLYDYLLAEPLKDLGGQEQIIVVPDGVLGYVPFEVLLADAPKDVLRFQDYPYLVKDFNISYAYASALWLENEVNKKPVKDAYTFAGFAPIYPHSISSDYQRDSLIQEGGVSPLFAMTVRGGLSDLIYARKIVGDLADLLGGQKWLAEAATKENFQKMAANYGVLHLAMHGIIDDENPLYSHLVFTETDNKEDNRLTAAELYNMQLNAGLAVLSACNTGVGELKRGEGIMSLSRAFAFAGCPSIVMSLWSVPDEQTGMLMENFYKELKTGATKDEALRQAKLQYLQKQDNQGAHPYLWAGFVVIGDTDAINFDESWGWFIWMAIGLGLFLLIVAARRFLLKKRRI